MWGSLVVVLWTSLFTVVVPLVIRVLAGIGIGFVTYQGFDFVFTQAEAFVMSQFAGLPADALAIARIGGFDQGIRIFFAAWSARLAIQTALGAMERWRSRPSTLRA